LEFCGISALTFDTHIVRLFCWFSSMQNEMDVALDTSPKSAYQYYYQVHRELLGLQSSLNRETRRSLARFDVKVAATLNSNDG
jgi:hypothetical protein